MQLLGLARRAELEGRNTLLLLLLQVWQGKGFTAMTAHTLLSTSCLTELSCLLSLYLEFIYIWRKGQVPLFLDPSLPPMALGWLLHALGWSPRALMDGSLLGASSEMISHPTPLTTPLPGFTAISQAAPASVLSYCSQTLPLSSQYFISFCGWWLVMTNPCCSFLPQRWIF